MNWIELDLVAAQLEALEETIIHRFIDRAQFAHNERAYRASEIEFNGAGNASLFHLRLVAQERLDAEFGRYHVPEERPYTSDLPTSRRKVHLPETGLSLIEYDLINQSVQIREAYLSCLKDLCKEGDDGQYGSSVEHDVAVLQAVARRVHYGALYIAEAKYRRATEEYRELINAGDTDALMKKLTRPEVEEAVITRLSAKVTQLQTHVNRRIRRVIAPRVLVEFYRTTVIPLTKHGQIAYLLARG